MSHPFIALAIIKEKKRITLALEVLQIHSKDLSQLTLPPKVLQMLRKSGIISKNTFYEIERQGNVLNNGPLEALNNTVSNNPNLLTEFALILLQYSDETESMGKTILKDYG